MIKIMLCCGAGMSSSLLVTKMQQAASDMNEDVEIWANPISEVVEHPEVDVILLGPQIQYAQKSTQKIVGKDIPVINIDFRSYGRMDGASVLKAALKAYRTIHE
ncbi:PTS sugar transporter subunit IIB [Intestinibaculum porci]|jgi:PTS system cellobiose-specific IIB component|uniref:PTS sugar transporter subunit IIB n=1 Tax=Intestinibaculum porci TaxID=2487118 RepID=A0A3G9JN21_9FIRM|nr:PTS sugar transporter subunit IIB [Intestinibaculum porci]BBH27411.1 PTS sugar transporter subunit IIB [Intestinibaculum porci]